MARKYCFSQLLVAYVFDYEDYIAMHIEVVLEMHN